MTPRNVDDTFAALARERGPALTGYAYLLTGDLAAAEDLVQDALLKVFVRTRTGFRPDVAEAYVRRTVLTLYVDGYRRRRHLGALRHLLARDAAHEGPDTSAPDRLDLRAALATLAPQERACVVLRFYEDLTVPEIAERMGLAPGTVKRYLSNAVRRLEAVLGPLPSRRPDAERLPDLLTVDTDDTTRSGS
ncbi:SigE family RNA polymerase sigma factor [Cellulomonas cellasea]|uniref:RNA polymerase subunit sigma-24 n=2 Tax=Cellulomonas cellasea TaxID=43670 RepID=A0A0A0BBD4_9CELL|nr:SigE family RNA polymerase sigma factor [Cellulomonas cellasea]KGM02621.1 RNA polymerase subunit sigma-24 [Cellulomonas cellasea DSM 20118]GEA87764.1 DNA-directed RNA polymerase sigma-70 factor [Cellulomonas cellasea]